MQDKVLKYNPDKECKIKCLMRHISHYDKLFKNMS